MLKASKYLKIGPYGIAAFVIIVLATLLRILLAALGWPQTNSDEGTIGMMAMHIAYHGDHPIFFYGQNYMGPLEAYLGAALFQLFGVSVFTLRLGMILLFALFLASTYLLTSLLYTKKLAPVSLVLLSLGSRVFFAEELTAIGGYAETLFFGSFAFLLASWLALSAPTYDQRLSLRKHWWRFVGYGCWGLVVGLGLWSDFLVLPFVLMAGVLLVLFCWRELWRWAAVLVLAGLVLGAFPLIVYNVTALPGQDSWTVLKKLQQDGSTNLSHDQNTLVLGIEETVSITLPLSTGAPPLCFAPEVRKFGSLEPHTLQCTLIHLSWGLGYITLWTIAVLLAMRGLWKLWHHSRARLWSSEERQTAIRHFARLMLLGAAGLALALYIVSPTAVLRPISTRYLVGLMIALPAVIAPLLVGSCPRAVGEVMVRRWAGSSRPRPTPTARSLPGFSATQGDAATGCAALPSLPLRPNEQRETHADGRGGGGAQQNVATPLVGVVAGGLIQWSALLVIGITFLIGTISTFPEIPSTQAINQQQYALVNDLLRIGATHIYSEYWTCNRIALQSREQIICAVLGRDLQPTHNRYLPYLAIVRADPYTAYVFPIGSPEAAASAQKAALSDGEYRHFVFDGYVIYQPIANVGCDKSGPYSSISASMPSLASTSISSGSRIAISSLPSATLT